MTELVVSTSASIAIGTMSEVDGTTRLRLTNGRVSPGTEGLAQVFDGELETPSKTICIGAATGEIYLRGTTNGNSTRIKVWVNDRTEPDLIVVEAPSVNIET